MKMPAVLLVVFLVTCSVWSAYGRCIEIDDSDQENMTDEIPMEASKLPGLCWACKWTLNKVKKALSVNSTVEQISSKLKGACDQIGLLKSKCRNFVQKNLGELVEELTTTDDVRTICVNMKACKPKEFDKFDKFDKFDI